MICYTDWSALMNPWPWWRARVVIQGDSIIKRWSGGISYATNNQMELQAVIDVLEHHLPGWSTPTVDEWLFNSPLKETRSEVAINPMKLKIITDSTYVQQWVTKWLDTWVRRWWRRSKWWKSIANLDQWMKLHSMLEYFSNLNRERTRSHVWTKWNERADREAKKQAVLYSK